MTEHRHAGLVLRQNKKQRTGQVASSAFPRSVADRKALPENQKEIPVKYIKKIRNAITDAPHELYAHYIT